FGVAAGAPNAHARIGRAFAGRLQGAPSLGGRVSLAAAVFDGFQAMPYESRPRRGNDVSGNVPLGGYCIEPRHAGPRACAIGGFHRLFDAGPVPCRTRLSVASEGYEGAVAAAAVAAPTKEHAETFTDPCAHLQGRIGT